MNLVHKILSFKINNNTLHIIDNDDPDLILKTINYNDNKIKMKNGNYILKISQSHFEDSDYKIEKIMIINDLYFNEKLAYKPKSQLTINNSICLLFSQAELITLKHFINSCLNKSRSNIILYNNYLGFVVDNGTFSINTCDNIYDETIGISISFKF